MKDLNLRFYIKYALVAIVSVGLVTIEQAHGRLLSSGSNLISVANDVKRYNTASSLKPDKYLENVLVVRQDDKPAENAGNSDQNADKPTENPNNPDQNDETKFTSSVLKSGPFFGSLTVTADGANKRVCTVTIITPKTFLTSYECVSSLNLGSDLSSINIFVGDNKKFLSAPQGDGIKVSRAYLNQKSGLSILTTDSDLEFNENISAIPITIRNLDKGDIVFLLKPEPFEEKPFNKIVLADVDKCKQADPNFVSQESSQICTDPYDGQTRCNDKMGGDPIIGFSTEGLTLVGISGSYKAPAETDSSCANSEALMFSTKISDYIGFISLLTGANLENITSTSVVKFTNTDVDPTPKNSELLANITSSVESIANSNTDDTIPAPSSKPSSATVSASLNWIPNFGIIVSLTFLLTAV